MQHLLGDQWQIPERTQMQLHMQYWTRSMSRIAKLVDGDSKGRCCVLVSRIFIDSFFVCVLKKM